MQMGAASQIGDPAPDRVRLEALLAGVAAGDREAFSALYAGTRGAVYAAALGILKNAQDAQDTAQDAFVRIWDSAGQYRPQGSPMAWILAITRKLALMRLRQNARTGTLAPEEWDAIPAADGRLTAEDRAVLQTAMEHLSDAERQIVLLHAASGLKHREIGQLLGLPLATVLSKYHRALKKMRTQLEGDDAL